MRTKKSTRSRENFCVREKDMVGEMSEKQAGKQPQRQGDQSPNLPPSFPTLICPRCTSVHTRFCFYNNNNVSEHCYFCKNCCQYWIHSVPLQNLSIGGTSRKRGREDITSSSSGNWVSPNFTTTQSLLLTPPQFFIPPQPPVRNQNITSDIGGSIEISAPRPTSPQFSIPPQPPIRNQNTTSDIIGSAKVGHRALMSATTENLRSSNSDGIPRPPPLPPLPSFPQRPPSHDVLRPPFQQQQQPPLATVLTNRIVIYLTNTTDRFISIRRGSTPMAEEVSTSEWTDLKDMEIEHDPHQGNEPPSP